ncbi:hypothetical protein ACLMNJ_27910 [Streptomyces seoulensis]
MTQKPALTRAVASAIGAVLVLQTFAAGTAYGQDAPPASRTAASAPRALPAAAGAEGPRTALATALAGAREQVRRIALSALPAELRTSAWNALRSSRGDAAITEWLAPGGGYDLAKQRLRDTRTRNRLFCERVVSTHPAEFAPGTRAAAERALKGTDADRAAFVKSGYDTAQLADRRTREAAAEQQQTVREADRAFVTSLAEHDPGGQVRVSAQWALRPGAGDEDIREFFAYGWTSGGALDLEGHRLRTADSEALRHRTLTLLLKAAVEAEEALDGAADAAAARAEAERAWQAVAGHARDSQAAWLAERELATRQAASWNDIQALAQGSAQELWKLIAGPAGENRQSWTKEEENAVGSAAFWQDVLRQASDGATRVSG